MLVEMLGFLIIIGALIYIVLRRQGLLTYGDGTGLKSAEATADKIRFEMEKSADEIINRLAEHIDRLESLIAQAEEVSAKLDGRLTRLRKEIHAAQESGILPVMTTEQLKSAATAPPTVGPSVRPQPVEPNQARGSMPEPVQPRPYPGYSMGANQGTDGGPEPVQLRPYTGYSAGANQETAGGPENLAVIVGEAAEDVTEATEFARLLNSTIEATEAAALEISSLPARNKVVQPEPAEQPKPTEQVGPVESPGLSSVVMQPELSEPAGSVGQTSDVEAPALPHKSAEPEPSEQASPKQKPKRIDYYARARELKEQQPAYPETGIEAIKPVEAAALKAAARVSAVSELTPTEEARRLLTAGYATEDIAKKVRLGKGAIELLRQMGGQGR